MARARVREVKGGEGGVVEVQGQFGVIKLTSRQLEIIKLIDEGCSNEEVAVKLNISPRTAKAHSDTIRHKLGVDVRRRIPEAARQLGII